MLQSQHGIKSFTLLTSSITSKKDWCVTRWPQTRMRYILNHNPCMRYNPYICFGLYQITRFTGVLAYLVNIHVYHINKQKVSCRLRITKTIFPHTIPKIHWHLQEISAKITSIWLIRLWNNWQHLFPSGKKSSPALPIYLIENIVSHGNIDYGSKLDCKCNFMLTLKCKNLWNSLKILQYLL